MNDIDVDDTEAKFVATNEFLEATICGIAQSPDDLFGDPYLSAINCRLGETTVPPHSSYRFVRDFDSAIGICDTLPLSGSLAVAVFPKHSRTLTKSIHVDVPAYIDVCHYPFGFIRCSY